MEVDIRSRSAVNWNCRIYDRIQIVCHFPSTAVIGRLVAASERTEILTFVFDETLVHSIPIKNQNGFSIIIQIPVLHRSIPTNAYLPDGWEQSSVGPENANGTSPCKGRPSARN